MNMTGSSDKIYDKAPGNILQNMYIKLRLRKILKSNKFLDPNFIELGLRDRKASKIIWKEVMMS